MFELVARKRAVNGTGFPYEHIEYFDNIDNQYYMIDKLNPTTYQERMVVEDNRCITYVEFEKPLQKIKKTRTPGGRFAR